MTVSAAATAPEQDRLSALARERYRNAKQLCGSWNKALDAILSHRSVRSYLPNPVPAEMVEVAVAAAQSAPSSSNLQAWSVVAVEDSGCRSRLNAIAGNQRQIAQAPLLLVWLADRARPRAITTDRSGVAEGLDYLESFLLGVIDASLAAQNAVVAIESLGLGTCYIGALRNDPEAVSRELELPEGVFPVFGLTVGYPDPALPAGVKPRLPQTIVLHRERYERRAPNQELDDYSRYFEVFRPNRPCRRSIGPIRSATGLERLRP